MDIKTWHSFLELNTYRFFLKASNSLRIENHFLNIQRLINDLKQYENVSNGDEGEM